jgi:hypothetical protein
MLEDFGIEIGTSFGPLHGKVWRIGTMGYNARKDCVMTTLSALESVLNYLKFTTTQGAAMQAAWDHYRARRRNEPGGRAGDGARRSLAAISETPDALTRVYLSTQHLQANQLVGQWMRQAGMTVWQDSVGNICGRYEGAQEGAGGAAGLAS